jgi:hypothetical protein
MANISSYATELTKEQYRESVSRMKETLRDLSRKILVLKGQRKSVKYGYIPELNNKRVLYRCMHTAYCLFRGKTIEQIEKGNKNTCENSPLTKYWLKIMQKPDPIKLYPMEKTDRLYILVDQQLSTGQKIAQSGHAVAEFMLKCPGYWENDTIIILSAPQSLIKEAISLGAISFLDSYYEEPKAVAFASLSLDTSQLPLAV